MKLKYYTRGLGVGILFSIMVFAIAGDTKETLSEEDIIKAAEALGMTLPTHVDLAGLEPTPLPTLEHTTTPAVEHTTTPAVEPTTTPAVEPTATPTVEPTATPAVEPTATPAVEPTATPTETITLIVSKGMYSKAVSDRLYQLGLVKDADEYDKYLMNNGYASGIRTNTYEIPSNASYKEIAELITKRPE